MPGSENHKKQTPKRDFHVLIAAAGKGTRLQSDTPKQYLPLHGKAVLRHSIETFLSMPECRSVQVIINSQDADLYHEAVKGLKIPNPIEGGEERNISINNGLNSLSNLKNENIILIHDAARPCVQARDIEKLLEAFETHNAATLASSVSSTMRYEEEGNAGKQVNRNGLHAIQTPQAFRYELLRNAHEKADPKKIYTDDTALVSAAGIPVKLVEGSASNIKITTAEDFKMAEQLLSRQSRTHTGTGFDVHAFDTKKPGPLRLCGIDVEHAHTLKGHSDADVGLHALTDAILGAIGEGDIGRHFPPSDNTFKNMDSSIFLKKAMELLKAKGGTLQNADITLICEAPKIGPHAEEMRKRIADITDTPEERINIKATTTEGLGFTGRGEGIAAQAIASISLPENEE